MYFDCMTNQKHEAYISDERKGRGDRRARIVEAARKLLAEEGYDRVT
ncbi:MAG: hypothetical protein H0X71_11770, partial [Rubrobacter sp.]|nr:hypothetical protein [Rubrobacter sp.]